MKIEALTLADLRLNVDCDEFFCGPLSAITRQRALSQVRNPRARDDDILLLVAREGERLVGFLGILPDTYRGRGGERRFGWISGWWVEPDAAKTGVGAILLMKALALWQGRLAVAGFTESARRVYEGCGRFQPVIENPGLTIDLRLDKDVLCRRLPILRRLGPLSGIISGSVGLMQGFRCRRWRRRHRCPEGRSVQSHDRIDPSVAAFLDAHRRDEVLWRSSAEIGWMMAKPWVATRPRGVGEDCNYPFSAWAQSFEIRTLEVRDVSDGLKAFLMVTLRDGELKLPIAVIEEGEAAIVTHAIVTLMIDVGASRMTTYHPCLIREFKKGSWPVLAKRQVQRLLVFSKKLDDADFSNLVFSDGEGDGGFT